MATTTLSFQNQKFEFAGIGSSVSSNADLHTATSRQQIAINNLEIRMVAIQDAAVSPDWSSLLIDIEVEAGARTYPAIRLQGFESVKMDSKFQLDKDVNGNGQFYQMVNLGGAINSFVTDKRVFFRDKEITVVKPTLSIDPTVTINGLNMNEPNFLELSRSFTLDNLEVFRIKVTHNTPTDAKLILYTVLEGIAVDIP